MIALAMLCAKTDCLVTDEKAEHRPLACAPSGHAVRCLLFSGLQLRCARRLQLCVRQLFRERQNTRSGWEMRFFRIAGDVVAAFYERSPVAYDSIETLT